VGKRKWEGRSGEEEGSEEKV
jgi:hypothetical protein